MPNQRREGWTTSTYSAPRDLVEAAQTKAAADATTVSAVIRAALHNYTEAP